MRVAVPRAGDRTTAALQQQAHQAATDAEKAFGTGGRLLENIEIESSTYVDVQHRLGRIPVGFVTVWCRSGPAMLEGQRKNRETLRIFNHAPSTVRLAIWVW